MFFPFVDVAVWRLSSVPSTLFLDRRASLSVRLAVHQQGGISYLNIVVVVVVVVVVVLVVVVLVVVVVVVVVVLVVVVVFRRRVLVVVAWIPCYRRI